MKESGINYFFDSLGINTGIFGIFHTFEDGGGSTISSISLGQSQYSATLNDSTNFWTSPGSGFFSGNFAQIGNASGLDSIGWTKIISYERISVDPCILFDSLINGSGYRIGITESNKPYLQSFNQESVIAASLNNYSSKNVITFTYLPNYLTLGYYNFNSNNVETETFAYPFQITRSDYQILGSQFTGYMDYHMHFTQPLSADIQSQLLSGLWAYPTGTGFLITEVCTTGITGFQDVFVGSTGITGYIITPGGDQGRDYFTGQFPTNVSTLNLTGYLSSGLYSSGIAGTICYSITGNPTVLFQYLTGYAASFGMEKIQLFSYIQSTDFIKTSVSYTPFLDIYNKFGYLQYSGYLISNSYTDTGLLDIFMNGVALSNYGWTVTGSYIMVTGSMPSDSIFFDVIYGDKLTIEVDVGITGYNIIYTGQELYINGINIVSGADFISDAGLIYLRSDSTGFSGTLSEYPVVLNYQTGTFSLWTGNRFWRDTSNEYLNGVRQENYSLYTEGAIFDMLSGNRFNPDACSILYDDNGNYWE